MNKQVFVIMRDFSQIGERVAFELEHIHGITNIQKFTPGRTPDIYFDFRKQFKVNVLKREQSMKDKFNKCGVDYCDIYTHEGYIKPLMNLFKRR